MQDEFALARAFHEVILKTQYLTAPALAHYQGRLLGSLCAHARKEVPFYGERADTGDVIEPGSDAWLSLPFVTRADLAARPLDLRARTLPRGHGATFPVQSGGSTGRPVAIDLSGLETVARVVSTYRMFGQWGFDSARPLFMIRKAQAGSHRKDGVGFRKWSYPWRDEAELGDRIHLDIETPVEEQINRIAARAPAYLNTLPSNILRLGLAAQARGLTINLPFVIAVAEYLAPEVRELAETAFGARVINVLSSSEGGVIAIECPVSGLLHIQSELVLAEILDDDGRPVGEGEAGELVVTALYNYANPLIRYRSGDYVVKGPACSCGSTLPTIAKIAGRREHMFRFAGGRRELPPIDRVRMTARLGHEAWQLVQTAEGAAELQVAGKLPAGDAKAAIEALLQDATGGSFTISLREVPALPLTTGGKRHFCVNRVGLAPRD